MKNSDDLENAKYRAIKYLGISKKTEYEVIRKLKMYNFSDEHINDVIKYLKNLDYINDEDYVDAYIRQCMRLQNFSIYEISNKLLQKGIKKELLDEKLEILKKTDYEKKLIAKLLKTKCANYDEQKIKQYLYRRRLNFIE